MKKCLAVGMRPECVVPENQCAIKRKEKKAQKEKDKGVGSGGGAGGGNGGISSSAPLATQNNNARSENSYKEEILPQLMKCESPPHTMHQLLPEKLLVENRNKGLIQLTANQMAVIYKLIWYQDGYEQPSEEDLKRIHNVSEKREEFSIDLNNFYFSI